MEDGEEDEDEEIPLDMEEVEAASKKARQDDEIHSEHIQVFELQPYGLPVFVTTKRIAFSTNAQSWFMSVCLLTVSWNLRIKRATPDSVPASLKL